jgi:hypothetical protein
MQVLVRHLGEQVIAQEHVLLNGCRNEFDRLVAKSAFDKATATAADPTTRVISYAAADTQPAHGYGTVLKSRLRTWGLEFKRLQVPEPVHRADAVVVVGGQEGTLCAVNWARIDKKPVLPITAFGGAADTAYHEELKDFGGNYADRVSELEYEVLNQIPTDLAKVAKDAVALAARMTASRHVFAVMSFSPLPHLQDAYDTFREVSSEFRYECHRIDDAISASRIIPEIFAGIRRSAFVIVDLTGQSSNVYYEMGLAQGLGKHCIVTAAHGTSLPFDLSDVPVVFWESQRQLKEGLRRSIRAIASNQGR